MGSVVIRAKRKSQFPFTVWIQFYSLYYTSVTQPVNIIFSLFFNEDKYIFLDLKYMFTKYHDCLPGWSVCV